MSHVYAAVDLGSHTVRSLVAEVGKETGVVRPVEHKRDFTRFALTTEQDGSRLLLDRTSVERVQHILSVYKDRFQTLGVKKVICGATGVFRKAENGAAILESIKNRFGFFSFIASEREEAIWSTIGALQVLNSLKKEQGSGDLMSSKIAFFDLGGSSTEVVFLDNGNITWWKSFFIGAASLTRKYIPLAPAEPSWIEKARIHAEVMLQEFKDSVNAFSPDILIGGGGTVATLGAIKLKMTDYVPYRVCGIEIDRFWIDELLNHLASLSLEERKSVPGLEKGREDVIIGGAIIVSVIGSLTGKKRLIITDSGFLEGVLIKGVLDEISGYDFEKTDQRAILESLTWKIEKR